MSYLEHTDTGDAPDAEVEQAVRRYYQYAFQRFGEPPSTDALMARIAPPLHAVRDATLHADHPPAVDSAVASFSSVVPMSDRRRTGAWWGWRRGMRRVGLLPALVAAALLLGGAALVAAPLVARILSGDAGASAVHDQHLGREVHLAETAAGQTMTIAWIYADANRIVLAYTVQASSGQALDCFPFSPLAEMLTDDAGRQYPENGGGGGADIPLPAHQPAPSECVLTFDAAALAGRPPTTLHLHLVLWPPCAGQPVFPALPLDPRGIAAQCPKPASQARSEAQAEAPAHAHAGPPAFAFDLAIPFYGGTVVTVGQTLSADGKTVTLQRVVVAPSETRLYVHDIDPQIGLAPSSPPTVASITVDGKTAFPLIAGAGFEVVNCTRSGDCGRTSLDVVYDLPAPAVAVHGRWVVTFRSDEPRMPGDESALPTWTFRFQI